MARRPPAAIGCYATKPRTPHLRRKAGRAQAVALLSVQPTGSVEVALDFYKILRISHVASRETILRAHDE